MDNDILTKLRNIFQPFAQSNFELCIETMMQIYDIVTTYQKKNAILETCNKNSLQNQENQEKMTKILYEKIDTLNIKIYTLEKEKEDIKNKHQETIIHLLDSCVNVHVNKSVI
jgi:hypothetical protein